MAHDLAMLTCLYVFDERLTTYEAIEGDARSFKELRVGGAGS